jgi:hypothetical protein
MKDCVLAISLVVLAAACDSVDTTPAAGSGGTSAQAGSPAPVVAGNAAAGSPGSSANASGSAGTANAGNAAANSGSGGTGSVARAGAAGNAPPPGVEASTPGQANSDPRFINLAPMMGEPLDGVGNALTPPAPDGWTWYQIEGAMCRDGSPTGFYVHTGKDSRLLIYLEGGGACSNVNFCAFNTPNVDTVLAGDGLTVIGTALGAIAGRQQPGVYTQATHDGAGAGIFDLANADNPFKDWSQIYIPYCTGDVFFGTKRDGSLPGLSNQQFVGYLNMKLFMARIVPTFAARVSRVILTGASAGAFGAILNFSMVQDSFGDVPVDLIDDSGPLFDDRFMPACMQKRWREQWGFDAALPADCDECRQPDGGGLVNLATYVLRKHPRTHVAVISGMQDEVIRLFYSVGLSDCANYDAADPVKITVQQLLDPARFMAGETYSAGLSDLRARYQGTKRLATFYIGGDNQNLHQHLFRPELYTDDFGDLAHFVRNFLDGKVEQVGP